MNKYINYSQTKELMIIFAFASLFTILFVGYKKYKQYKKGFEIYRIHNNKKLKAKRFKQPSKISNNYDFCLGCCFPMYQNGCNNAPSCVGDIGGKRYGWVWDEVEY